MWKGDILVADIEELENLDASEIHVRRLNAKEKIKPKNGQNFMFSKADGTAKFSGRDYGVGNRKSTLMRDQTVRSEEHSGALQRSSDKSQPIDETTDDAETRNEFLSIEENYIHRHHVESRVQLYVPKEETFSTH